MLGGELAEPSLDESCPGVPVFEDPGSPGRRDCDPHGTAIRWIGLTNGKTGFFEPIDQSRHAGLRQLLELGEFRYSQGAKCVEPTQGAQGAC